MIMVKRSLISHSNHAVIEDSASVKSLTDDIYGTYMLLDASRFLPHSHVVLSGREIPLAGYHYFDLNAVNNFSRD